ncbi:MAG: helix-turn-helix domain-containing protein [Patescibacteria group bacterium]
MQILETLHEIGLEGKRADVYLALLKLRSASVNQIAKQAGVQRTTCYEILDYLVREALANFTTSGRTRLYCAEPPEKLVAQQREQTKKVEHALPELQALFGTSSNRPRVRYYEGIKGIKTVFEDTLTAKQTFLKAMLSIDEIEKTVGARFLQEVTNKRIVAGLKLHVMQSEPTSVEHKYPTSKKDNRIVHYTPDQMPWSISFYLYDNKIALIGTRKENFGMIIESEEFFQTMNHLFDVWWQVTRVGKTID